jgi:hypothetical protein
MNDPRMMQARRVRAAAVRLIRPNADALHRRHAGARRAAGREHRNGRCRQRRAVPELLSARTRAGAGGARGGDVRRGCCERGCCERGWRVALLTRSRLTGSAAADEEKAEKEAKAAAQKEKELGNECYKARTAQRRACVCMREC